METWERLCSGAAPEEIRKERKRKKKKNHRAREPTLTPSFCRMGQGPGGEKGLSSKQLHQNRSCQLSKFSTWHMHKTEPFWGAPVWSCPGRRWPQCQPLSWHRLCYASLGASSLQPSTGCLWALNSFFSKGFHCTDLTNTWRRSCRGSHTAPQFCFPQTCISSPACLSWVISIFPKWQERNQPRLLYPAAKPELAHVKTDQVPSPPVLQTPTPSETLSHCMSGLGRSAHFNTKSVQFSSINYISGWPSAAWQWSA